MYAIEMSTIAERAKEIVQENGYSNVITIIQGKVEDVQLPVDKASVCVTVEYHRPEPAVGF